MPQNSNSENEGKVYDLDFDFHDVLFLVSRRAPRLLATATIAEQRTCYPLR